jgi:phage terminase large subunit GpA-like protein
MAMTTTLTKTVTDYSDLALACIRPRESQDLWDWCADHLIMPSGNRWDPRRAALMRHWYHVAGARLSGKAIARDPYAHRCEQLYLSVSAQLAKTTLGHAVLLASLCNYQRQCALFMGRKDDINNARERKLKPQVEKTACIEQLLPRSVSAREHALGSRSWSVGLSLLYFRVGSVADDLRADPMDTMVLDEFDTYPLDVEGYGDPVDQALARQRTFKRTKLLIGSSTPGAIAGHAWRRTCSGTHERLLIPCPHCGGHQDLDPRQICLANG